MTIKYDGHVEKKISTLIENQFPEFYHEEGPVFIEFVKQYYNWLETESHKRKEYVSPGKSWVNVEYGNNQVTGHATSFRSTFSAGDKIALSAFNAEDHEYCLFQIESISNNSHMVIDPDYRLPEFACNRAKYAQVITKPNTNYYSRRYLDIIDVDRTIESFIVYFKEQFLKNIDLGTVTDTQTLVKHSLDLYRSKGTERGLKLLFRIAFGEDASIYHPIKDVFRLSDGDFYIPTYLELQPKEITTSLTNKQITGVQSGATAFVDSVFRRSVHTKFVDIAFISSIRGSFQTGEQIITSDGVVTTLNAPIILGSLNTISLPAIGQGVNFSVGDILNVNSASGSEGVVRVAATSNASGIVSPNVLDGGYAFTGNSAPVVSNLVVTLDNTMPNVVAYTDNDNYIKNKDYFEYREVMTQPKALIEYEAATDTITTGNLYSYHANGDVDGTGYIYNIEAINSSTGEFSVSIISGNIQTLNAIYTEGNAISANISSYEDRTSTGNVVGLYSNTILGVTINSGTFISGERLLGRYGNTDVLALDIVSGAGDIRTTNPVGIFQVGDTIQGANSGASANVISIKTFVGIKDVSNTFVFDANNYVTFTNGGNGSISAISNGSGFTFGVSNALLYSETINVDSNPVLSNYTGVALDAASYGIASNTSANLINFPLEVMIDRTTSTEIGTIQTLRSVNPGVGYNIIPVVRMEEPLTSRYARREMFRFHYSNASATFANGELVTQEATSGRGIVRAVSNTFVEVENLRFWANNRIIPTVNATTYLYGELSGTTANVDSFDIMDASDFHGFNAEIEYSAITTNNAVSEIEVMDSGVGFVDAETVNIFSNTETITGTANVSTHGSSRGFYRDRGGFLSNDKKLHDGNYYQQFSYEIRSSKTLDKYIDMLRKTVHVAGVSVFANQVFSTIVTANSSAADSTITTG